MRLAISTAVLVLGLAAPALAGELDPLLERLSRRAGLTATTRVRVLGVGSDAGQRALGALGAVVKPVAPGSRVFTAELPRGKLVAAAALAGIERLEASVPMTALLDRSLADMGARSNRPPYDGVLTGRGVAIGVVDTGVDLEHQDLRDEQGRTRVTALWDQTTGERRDGSLVDGAKSTDTSGHGTHVASIAAGTGRATGNGAAPHRYVGVAPRAELVVVKSTLLSADVLEAVRWCFEKALDRPLVVNLSVGSHYGPHDGSGALSAGIDALLEGTTGRAVVVAAGNEHGRRLHARRAPGRARFVVELAAYTARPGAENDQVVVDLWHPRSDSYTVEVTGPGGRKVSFESRTHDDVATRDGNVFCSNATSSSRKDGARRVTVALDDRDASTPPRAGRWTIELVPQGSASSEGAIDGWIALDDRAIARFEDGDDTSTIAMPGDAERAITVGAYVTRTDWTTADGRTARTDERIGEVASFSSRGPTRDGRAKPDVGAPGSAIAGARSRAASFDPSRVVEDGAHVVLSGTSMAAPHAAGLVALVFENEGKLSPDEVRARLRETARSNGDPRLGAGKLDARAAGKPAAPPPDGNTLAIATIDLPPARAQARYSTRIAAKGGRAPYVFTLDAGAAPPGTALAPDGTLAGAPLLAGVFGFTVAVRDGTLAVARRDFVLHVLAEGASPPRGFTISTAAVHPIRRHENYGSSLLGVDGKEPCVFELVSGKLPDGISLRETGRLTGETRAAAGTFSVRVRARDAEGRRAEADVKLTVTDGVRRFALVERVDLQAKDRFFEWYAHARVRIVDEAGKPWSGAGVKVRFSGASGVEEKLSVTDGDGWATLGLDSPRGWFGTYEVEVVELSGTHLVTDANEWKARAARLTIGHSFGNWARLIF